MLCRPLAHFFSFVFRPEWLEVVHHTRIGQGRGVAQSLGLAGGELAQDATHDLARAGSRAARDHIGVGTGSQRPPDALLDRHALDAGDLIDSKLAGIGLGQGDHAPAHAAEVMENLQHLFESLLQLQ